MYGTRGRQILCHDDLKPDYAAALARAYNDWAADYCKTDPTRLKFAAQVAMHDVGLAVEEARRSVTELGAVAVIGTPNPVNGQHLHDDAVEPLWDALEELNVPIGFHPTGNTSLKDDAGRRYVGHANFHPIAHAIRNPVELMGAIASLTTGGVMERHPKLRAAFLEGTAGWLPWWLWRLDDQWEKFGPGCERPLSMLPSEYFQPAMLHRARCRRGAGDPRGQRHGRRVFRRVERLPALRRRFPRRDEGVLRHGAQCRAAAQDPVGQLRPALRDPDARRLADPADPAGQRRRVGRLTAIHRQPFAQSGRRPGPDGMSVEAAITAFRP